MTRDARPRICFAGSRRGFTLVEVLVVIGIFTVMTAALLLSLSVSRSSYVSADAYVQVQQEVRRAFDSIVKELHQAGRVNNSVTIANPGAQRLDFQLALNYDAALCGGTCWGTDDAAFPAGWLHYVLDAADPQNARLMRCATANRLDPMPAGFAGCRVLANRVDPALASTSFEYDHGSRTVMLRLQTLISSQQLPTGSIAAAPAPLVTRVRLRNS